MSNAANTSTFLVHGGFEPFRKGRFDDGGSNLYATASGAIEMIHRTDVNNDGIVDIVLPNNHGYTERGPTWIYAIREAGARWTRTELPNDSSWMSRIADVDGDGYPDLVVVNGENGVTSALPSYIYWGGPSGLTGERSEFPTCGAYDVALLDLTGAGWLDVLFTSAWEDHHNPGRPRPIQVFHQVTPRRFEDATARYGLNGVAAVSLAAGDLNGDGYPDLVVANYRAEYEYECDSFIYWGGPGGFEKEPTRLPTHFALQALLADLNGDGRPEVIFCGGDQVQVFWNQDGHFGPERRTCLEAEGFTTMFSRGAVRADVADVNGDGRPELLLATRAGIEIRLADDLSRVATFLPLTYATWVHAADLDGDGRPEILASRYEDGQSYDTESAVFWNGPEGFSPARVCYLPSGGAMGVSAGDLNGDGRPEVVLHSTMRGPTQDWVDLPNYIYLGGPGGTFDRTRRLELPSGAGSSGFVLADLDQDGYADLVVTSDWGLRVFAGGPDGPQADRFMHLRTPVRGIQQVQVADFNGDGWLDLLAVATTYDDKPETMAASSTIFWGSPEGYSSERCTNVPTWCQGMAHLADVNQDGYLDLLIADWRECVTIYYGGPEGYSLERSVQLPISTGWIGNINTADLNENGWLDLIVAIMGHYTRRPTSFHIFYGGPDGYSAARSQVYVGNYSAGQIAVADLNRDGHLDLVVPAYSTPTRRVLPAQIFWGDGKRIDLEHPMELPAEAGSAVSVIDYNQDGWPDVLMICHRDDIGHQANSLLYWNGPQGLSPARVTRLPGLGPHFVCPRDFGNAYTRQPYERYISPVLELGDARVVGLEWSGETPCATTLSFELRGAAQPDDLERLPWQGPTGPGSAYDRSGQAVAGLPAGTRWVQYRATFHSPDGCQSPRLSEVRLALE